MVQVQVKGSVVKETVADVKRNLKKDEYDRFISLLTEEGKKLFLDPIFSSEWYDLDVFTTFLETLVRERLNGDPKKLIKPTERATERQLKGIYSVFVQHGSPEFLWGKMTAVMHTYHKGVEIKSSIVSPGKATIQYIGFGKQHSVFENILLGFYHKALELCGAKDVNVEFTIPISAGKEYAELIATWSK